MNSVVYIPAMDRSILQNSLQTLIEKASTELPQDVRQALENAYQKEQKGSIAGDTLGVILESAEQSKKSGAPICQDTGSIMAIIRSRPDQSILEIEPAFKEATRFLTRKGILRQNCVDPLSGKNTGDNIGEHVPQVHFLPSDGPTTVSVMLKGGGSENVSTQYSLPDSGLDAGRDPDGVRKCILDAVFHAQGKGCAPGIIGACVGGDRASGYLIAKEMLFRRLDEANTCKILAKLEETVMEQANSLGIGPMGLGGRTTLLGARIGYAGRHPASFFVTISYSCWATRRISAELDTEGRIVHWL